MRRSVEVRHTCHSRLWECDWTRGATMCQPVIYLVRYRKVWLLMGSSLCNKYLFKDFMEMIHMFHNAMRLKGGVKHGIGNLLGLENLNQLENELKNLTWINMLSKNNFVQLSNSLWMCAWPVDWPSKRNTNCIIHDAWGTHRTQGLWHRC